MARQACLHPSMLIKDKCNYSKTPKDSGETFSDAFILFTDG